MMQFKGRSLYNLLQLSKQEDSSLEVEPWQICNYRSLKEEELFAGLSSLGIPLSKESFIFYAENADSPEDLVEYLWIEENNPQGEERTYLFVFELWRRLFPGRESISVFFDKLDFLISQFDAGELLDEEEVQEVLFGLQDILDKSVDQGEKQQEVFSSVLQYTAHDVEGFLYDYIGELLEEGNEVLASKLIDAFDPYVFEKKWFTLLRARLFSLTDEDRAMTSLHRILEEAEEEADLAFSEEVGRFLS